MKAKKRRLPGWLPGAAISLGLLAWLFLRLDWQAAMRAIWQAELPFLWLALAVNAIWLVVRVHAWQLAQAAPVSFVAALKALSAGYLLNALLPFRLGEVGRAYLLARGTALTTVGVLSTVFVERMLDLAFAAAFLLASLFFVTLGARTQALALALLVALVLALGLLLLAVRWHSRWMPLAQRRLGAFRWGGLLLQGGDHLVAGLSVLAKGGRAYRYLAWEALSWGLAIVEFWAVARAFVPEAAWWWGMFLLAAIAFGGAIPSLPGALGTLEAAGAAAAFLLIGREDLALAVGIMMRLYNYAIPFTFGVWALAQEGQSLPHLYQTLRALREGDNARVAT